MKLGGSLPRNISDGISKKKTTKDGNDTSRRRLMKSSAQQTRTFYKWMNGHYGDCGSNKPNVVSMGTDEEGSNRGGFYVPLNNEAYEKFLSSLSEYIFLKHAKLTFSEQHLKNNDPEPLNIDVDLSMQTDVSVKKPKRAYDSNMIKQIVVAFANAIEQICNLKEIMDENDRDAYYAYVSEKEAPSIKHGKYHDGLHIHFPYVRIGIEARTRIHELAIQELNEKQTFVSDLISTSCAPIDLSPTRTSAWMIYGCTRPPNNSPYLVSTKYTVRPNSTRKKGQARLTKKLIDKDDYREHMRFVEMFSLRNIDGLFTSYKSELVKDDTEHWYREKFEKKTVRIGASDAMSLNEITDHVDSLRKQDSNWRSDYERREAYVTAIPSSWIESYDNWKNLGCCLRNLSKFNYPIFRDACARTDYWKDDPDKAEAECEKLWANLDEGFDWTEASLIHWCREQNPEEFKKIRDNDFYNVAVHEYNRAILALSAQYKKNTGIGMSDAAIALLIKRYIGENYKCVDIKGQGEWYSFDSHRWSDMKQGVELTLRMRQEFESIFEDVLKRIADRQIDISQEIDQYQYQNLNNADDAGTLDDEEINAQIINNIGKLRGERAKLANIANFVHYTLGKITNSSRQNAIMKQLAMLYFDQDFVEEKVNKNVYLLGCNNGILDTTDSLKTGKVDFRDGRPEDSVSKTTKHNYRPWSDWMEDEPEICDNLMQVFESIYPDPETRNYVWMLDASTICGRRYMQIFVVLNGEGENGKSVKERFTKNAFGDYYANPPVGVLCANTKNSTGQEASPFTAALNGVRHVCFDEIESGAKMNENVVKKWTSGTDPITYRQNYGEAKEIYPQFLMKLTSNPKPSVNDSTDHAMWRRLRLLPHKVLFKMHPDPDDPNEKQANPDVETWAADKAYGAAYLSFLVHILETEVLPRRFQIVPPPEVEKATLAWRIGDDPIQLFLGEAVEKTGDPEDILDTVKLWGHFGKWYSKNFPGESRKNRTAFKEYLQKFYRPKNVGAFGGTTGLDGMIIKRYRIVKGYGREDNDGDNNSDKSSEAASSDSDPYADEQTDASSDSSDKKTKKSKAGSRTSRMSQSTKTNVTEAKINKFLKQMEASKQWTTDTLNKVSKKSDTRSDGYASDDSINSKVSRRSKRSKRSKKSSASKMSTSSSMTSGTSVGEMDLDESASGYDTDDSINSKVSKKSKSSKKSKASKASKKSKASKASKKSKASNSSKKSKVSNSSSNTINKKSKKISSSKLMSKRKTNK